MHIFSTIVPRAMNNSYFTFLSSDGHTTPFGKHEDLNFMNQALTLARQAFAAGEVPIGAVVVHPDGHIIGRGYNQTEHFCSQAGHAEMQALSQAGAALSNWRLSSCWLYVTLEPCSMCFSAARLSRVAGIVFAASSPLYGYQLDNLCLSPVYKNDTFVVISGFCSNESELLLKDFFQNKRQQQLQKKDRE